LERGIDLKGYINGKIYKAGIWKLV